MYLFLDECYNTGNNWLDQSQPFFTYGGWIISDENLSKAESIIQDFSNNHQGELKSKSFTSHKSIQDTIGLFHRIMRDCNSRPYFMCFEKYYMIACKVVEIFFDKATNSRVNGYLTFPNEYEYFEIISRRNQINIDYDQCKKFLPPINITKKGLAEVIMQNNDFCTYIGKILNGGSFNEKDVTDIILCIKSTFSDAGYVDISNIFEPKNFKIHDIYEELHGDKVVVNEKCIAESILVKTSIFEMVNNLINRNEKLTLVVDTLGEQNIQFSEISKYLNIPINVVMDSKSNFLIMASDLLVGQFARLINGIHSGSNDIIEKDLQFLKKVFLPSHSTFDEGLSYWYCKFSGYTKRTISDAIGLGMKVPNYKSKLINEFNVFVK